MSIEVKIERTYRVALEDLWDLWTTKAGFESWWGPKGYRVEVVTIEPRVGGLLHYDMITESAEQRETMKRMGRPMSHETRGKFSELVPKSRLALTHVIDFLPGVAPYENTMAVDFVPSKDGARMVVTLEPMRDDELTRLTTMGFESQLSKLDDRFAR